MKSLIFDSSTIISLATNNLLWTLEELKNKFNGEFYITPSVKKELIDYPLTTKKFKLEALMIQELLKNEIITVFNNIPKTNLLNLINQIYKAHNKYMTIVHEAETSSLALALFLNSNALIIDERTTRLVIENPTKLAKLFNKKLHTKIKINKKNLREFQKQTKNINIIRSVDLMVIMFEKGLLDKYVFKEKRTLLEGLLWGLKLKGCSIAIEEINEIIKLEKV